MSYLRQPAGEREDGFYRRLGPLALDRGVVAELGAPIYDTPEYEWVFACEGARVVGFGGLDRRRLSSHGLVALDWMYVVPDARRRGIGRELFEQLLRLAHEAGARTVRGATADEHVLAMYRDAGFLPWQQRGRWTYLSKELGAT